MTVFCDCPACSPATTLKANQAAAPLATQTTAVTDYQKFGSGTLGTSGGQVTWSFGSLSAFSGREQFDFTLSFMPEGYQSEIRRAFAAWETVANIDFVEVTDGSATDIRLGGDTIDGRSGTLGYAEWTYSGNSILYADVTFDPTERWTVDTSGISVFSVAVHEVGHALGLQHIDGVNSVMNAYCSNLQALTATDIAAIQSLYGGAQAPAVPTQPSVPQQPVPPANLVLNGGNGNDTLTGQDGNDSLRGNKGNDSLSGGAGADTLVGDAGNDLLDGGTGADKMSGGAGDDAYVVDNAGDLVAEKSGEGSKDKVVSSVDYTLGNNLEHLALSGSADLKGTGNSVANTITGNAGANTLDGAAGNDTLYGNDGNDTLRGGIGDDILYGGNHDDLVYGGTGNDTLRGENGMDVLAGEDGNDTIYGGTGNDWLSGGIGNDTLVGDAGSDTLYGGAGKDIFRFAAGWGVDTIADFQNGSDRIDLKGMHLSFGKLAVANVGADATITYGADQILVLGAAGQIDSRDFVF